MSFISLQSWCWLRMHGHVQYVCHSSRICSWHSGHMSDLPITCDVLSVGHAASACIVSSIAKSRNFFVFLNDLLSSKVWFHAMSAPMELPW